MAWFNLAIPVGSALGFVVGSLVSKPLGWRGAFVVTFGGLVLGALCFARKEFPRPATLAKGGPGYLAVLKQLRGNRSFVLCCLGMTAVTFVMGGVAAWLPVYVFEREAKFTLNEAAINNLRGGKDFLRSDGTPAVPEAVTAKLVVSADVLTVHQLRDRLKGQMGDDDFRQYSVWVIDATTADGTLNSSDVSLVFGVILVLAGLTATAAGAWLGEKLKGRVRGPYLLVSGLGALAAFPFVVGMLFLPFPWAWGCVLAAVFGLFLYTGPAFTLLANVTTPAVRATAFAINILVIHALGDAISPAILGAVADASDLHTAILASSALILVGGGLWLWGMRYEAKDTEKAERAENPAA